MFCLVEVVRKSEYKIKTRESKQMTMENTEFTYKMMKLIEQFCFCSYYLVLDHFLAQEILLLLIHLIRQSGVASSQYFLHL